MCIRASAAALIIVFARVIGAQLAPTIGAGVAIPGGAFGEHRSPGPLVRIGLLFGAPTSAVQLRLEGEFARMPGSGVTGDHTSFDVTNTALLGNLLVGARGVTAPYVLLGAAVQQLEVENVSNPYGLTGGLRAGVGLRLRVGETLGYVEALAHLNLTDHGAGDFEPGYFFPIVAGVRF